MKRSTLQLITLLICLTIGQFAYAGGPPMIYPTTSNSSVMTTQETLEIKGKLILGNVAGGQDPGDKMVVRGTDGRMKVRPIPINPGPPSLSAWQLTGGTTVSTNKDISTTGSIDASVYLLNGTPMLPGKWLENGSDIYFNSGAIGINTISPTPGFSLDVNGRLKALEGRINKITTAQINSSDDLSGLELIRFGDATTYLSTEYHRLLWLGAGLGTPAAQGFTIGNARFPFTGSFVNDFGCWLSANIEQRAIAANSIAIGYNLKVPQGADYAMVIGSGLTNGAPNICGNNNGTLTNSLSNSLMIGFNSDISTFFVGPSNGVGTSGNVGVGAFNSAALPESKLHVKKFPVANSVSISDDILTVENNASCHINVVSDNSGIGSLLFSDNVRSKGFVRYIQNIDRMQFGTGSTVKMTINHSGNVGIGVAEPANALDVCGVIRSHEWIVELFGCDFVFEKNYNLPTFQERRDFIKYNHHLMYVQSANEMQTDGAQMAGTTMGILRNVEEHELYLFKHDEQLNDQDDKIKLLQEENKRLQKDVQKLMLRLDKLKVTD